MEWRPPAVRKEGRIGDKISNILDAEDAGEDALRATSKEQLRSALKRQRVATEVFKLKIVR